MDDLMAQDERKLLRGVAARGQGNAGGLLKQADRQRRRELRRADERPLRLPEPGARQLRLTDGERLLVRDNDGVFQHAAAEAQVGDDLPRKHPDRPGRPDGQQHRHERPGRVQDEHPLAARVCALDAAHLGQKVQIPRQQPQDRAHTGRNMPPQQRHDGQQQHVIHADQQKHAQQQPQQILHRHLPPADRKADGQIHHQHGRQRLHCGKAAEAGHAGPCVLVCGSFLELCIAPVPDAAGEDAADDQPQDQPEGQCRAHSASSRSSSRSCASSSAVSPLALSAAAKADTLPPQSLS